MNITNTLPSIFNSDEENARTVYTDAPAFITHITAHVLGGLMAEQLIKYDADPMSALHLTESIIAAAVHKALDDADLMEATAAQNARRDAMWAARAAAAKARRVLDAAPHNPALERQLIESILRNARNAERASQGMPPLDASESPYSDALKRALAALDAFDKPTVAIDIDKE